VNVQIGIGAAFLAGLASFLSPCVLPMVPGYVSFLAALADTGAEEGRKPRSLIASSLLFIAGFTAVFVVLGSTASILGMALSPYRELLGRLAGVLVIAFGVLMLGIVKAPWLYREMRFDAAQSRRFGRWAPPAMGAAFAFGWTPCVGPILGSILLLAGSGSSVATGAGLLVVFSLGLGVPFVLFAVFLDRLTPLRRWLERNSAVVSRVGGVILIVFGILLVTGTVGRLTALVGTVVPLIGG